MFQIPELILKRLKCSICDGYLNSKPIVVKNEKQICAKCYKILPQEEKVQCLRQISYEVLASCMVFPCRYQCGYASAFGIAQGHESECPKRHFTIPDVVTMGQSNQAFKSDSLDRVYYNTHSDNIQYENIFHKDNLYQVPQNKLHKEPTTSQQRNNKNNDETYDESSPVNTFLQKKESQIGQCLSCHSTIIKSTKVVCLFGHLLCPNCKDDMCVACVKNLDGNSRIACKNASKGCQETLLQNDVALHRDNCPFNEVPCPVGGCAKKYTTDQLQEHLQEAHLSRVNLSDQYSRTMQDADQEIIFLCHSSIFKCLYYYYYDSVELVLVYWGPCSKSCDFYMEVSVKDEIKKKLITKRQDCANWNNYMLNSGLSFDKNELSIGLEKPLKFNMDMKILPVI